MKYLLALSGAFYPNFLLAQELTTLPSRIYNADHDHRGHHNDQEYFHAPRIASSLDSVLYREFANAKQLCKSIFEHLCGESLLPVVNAAFHEC